jgi:hypothetical protein
VLYPLKAKAIVCLAVVANSNSLVMWEAFILASLVELARQYHKRRKTPARHVNALNRCNPLTVT